MLLHLQPGLAAIRQVSAKMLLLPLLVIICLKSRAFMQRHWQACTLLVMMG